MAETDQRLGHSPNYQLKCTEIDIPHMVEYAQAELPKLRKQAVAAAVRSNVWQMDYPSLKSFPFKSEYKGYSLENGEPVDLFDQKTGAINIPTAALSSSILGEFFTPVRTRQQGKFTQLHGLTYYVSLDFSKNTPEKKLAAMTSDVKEGLDVINSVDRRNLNATDYLLYLGVLDHLKAHLLTAFHALTFHERTGSILDDADYLDIRVRAQKMVCTTTRAFHQAIIGQSFDTEFNLTEINTSLERTADFIANSDHSDADFNYLQVNNPVVILLGAHEAARHTAFPDSIIGIPSGGTEVAVVTHLMYENLYPDRRAPDIEFVPLSFHYRGQGGIDLPQLTEILRQSKVVKDRRVLIVDDNSNTGSTLQRMTEAAIGAGASDIAVHIAEIDPNRVVVKHSTNSLPFGVLNMFHPDLKTAMGVCQTCDQDGTDLRRKAAKRVVRELQKKTKKNIDKEKVELN